MNFFSTYDANTTRGADIITKAEGQGLDPAILYQAVIDLSSKGLHTANCINMAAGILLKDLGLPQYFFEHITNDSLANLLQSIAASMEVIDDRVFLSGSVNQVDFNTDHSISKQQVRIATKDTRDNMEVLLEDILPGRRRDYYFCEASDYYTYIIRPESFDDAMADTFAESRFLFTLDDDYSATPEPTRRRYENFLEKHEQSTVPLIEVFNLPETGETRLMFNSDFVSPQLPIFRKLLGDHGLILNRAYWEAYQGESAASSSICTLYVSGELTRKQEEAIVSDICSFLAFSIDPIQDLYLQDKITFQEMLFTGNCIDFCHLFIFKESENLTDREIFENLISKDQREAFARRIQGSNKTTYSTSVIREAVSTNPDLMKFLYVCFEQKFSPKVNNPGLSAEDVERKWQEFEKLITIRFIDFPVGYDVFAFMFKIITSTLKTNFYKTEKRSFSFRFDNRVLDPLVFSNFVYGIFYVNGHYACGTHLRAADIARGGLRLIRVSSTNYDTELDNAVLLNYALGPQAQRLKHKDICESGSKGVIIPLPQYAGLHTHALRDYTIGIMDLLMPDPSVIDYYGQQEIIFFGPDEGTAPLMDEVAYQAKAAGYPYWRTITTGKSFGIPHDTYGLLSSSETFGLFSRNGEGVELQVDGKSVVLTNDVGKIYDIIGDNIEISGMTTTSIMNCFRTLVAHYKQQEDGLNLMITGGPDGDLGANQIQCYKGKICLLIDGGGVLFDPEGLDKQVLRKIAFARNSSPRINSSGFPLEKIGENGFFIAVGSKNVTLPDGTLIEDGTLYHKTFLTNPENRKYIQQANIQAFIPCGGFKDTINQSNVSSFCSIFEELMFIVEGANVFFDDAARRFIATRTGIKHIKDSTANKGGVFSSSIAEVLTAFLLGEEYEERLLKDSTTRWALTKNVIDQVQHYSCLETSTLLSLHDSTPEIPLFQLSESSSEKIFSLQAYLDSNIEEILTDSDLVWKSLTHSIPEILQEKLGRDSILTLLNKSNLQAYRNTMITKKLASLAFYRFALKWEDYVKELESGVLKGLHLLFEDQ